MTVGVAAAVMLAKVHYSTILPSRSRDFSADTTFKRTKGIIHGEDPVHGIDVRAEVTELDDEGYVVALRGTAALSSVARGWFKTKIAWWRSDTAPGADILLDIAKSSKEPPMGTVFDAALYWAERSPGKGDPIWAARYTVRNTCQGPVLEELELAESA